MNLEKMKDASNIYEHLRDSKDWTLKTNVDCPWSVLLIPNDVYTESHFHPSIIYFNRKYINSEITVIPSPTYIYQTYTPFKVNSNMI